jgi:hypothetical protein
MRVANSIPLPNHELCHPHHHAEWTLKVRAASAAEKETMEAAAIAEKEALAKQFAQTEAKLKQEGEERAAASAAAIQLEKEKAEATAKVRCAFFDRNLHSRVPLDSTHVRLKLEHACDRWHFSRKFTPLTGLHCKSRPNTEGARSKVRSGAAGVAGAVRCPF